eukprot:jgi/Bigna1/70340/fgenesh1_pg.11_\
MQRVPRMDTTLFTGPSSPSLTYFPSSFALASSSKLGMAAGIDKMRWRKDQCCKILSARMKPSTRFFKNNESVKQHSSWRRRLTKELAGKKTHVSTASMRLTFENHHAEIIRSTQKKRWLVSLWALSAVPLFLSLYMLLPSPAEALHLVLPGKEEDCLQDAYNFFDNMRTPAAVLAGAALGQLFGPLGDVFDATHKNRVLAARSTHPYTILSIPSSSDRRFT